MPEARAAARHTYRLDYLDSLRGIAAILVVSHHVYQTAPFWPQYVRFSPARLLLNGRSSVIFFFVLSGFVLAYGLWRGEQPVKLNVFLMRRASRIYVPYCAAAFFALAAALALQSNPMNDTAITFNEMWSSPVSWRSAIGHLALLGTAEADAINTPSWSLVYELRVSLLIPILCLWANKSASGLAVTTLVVYTISTGALLMLGVGPVPYAASGIIANIIVTLHFSADFVVGLLLAKLALARSAWLFEMSSKRKCILGFIAVALLSIFHDETAVIGSALVLVLALNSSSFQERLRHPLLMWLGRLSFSLYLTHMIVLEFVVRVLHGLIPLHASIGLAVFAMIPFATAFYRLVEAPAARWSRRIGRPSDAARVMLAAA